jgi:hypothetical protein
LALKQVAAVNKEKHNKYHLTVVYLFVFVGLFEEAGKIIFM